MKINHPRNLGIKLELFIKIAILLLSIVDICIDINIMRVYIAYLFNISLSIFNCEICTWVACSHLSYGVLGLTPGLN